MLKELIPELKRQGVDFVRTVDISQLSEEEGRGYGLAVLIGMTLSPAYIHRLSIENIIDHSEFSEKEYKTDRLAEWTADFIEAKGYKGFAQSEKNLGFHGLYNEATKTTPLPHKKIALLAGLGWIGKNNLLVMQEYGSAVCMCSILTNAPLKTENSRVILPKCNDCTICKDICPTKAIHGFVWKADTDRDRIVDVYHCDNCLKCLSHCPWTQKYMDKNYLK